MERRHRRILSDNGCGDGKQARHIASRRQKFAVLDGRFDSRWGDGTLVVIDSDQTLGHRGLRSLT